MTGESRQAETPPRVVVAGASGFVGAAVAQALRRRGAEVTEIPAPRSAPVDLTGVDQQIDTVLGTHPELAARLRGADAVVNAAGDPAATSGDLERLLAANAVSAGVLAAACTMAGVPRFVHVSSAVVLGDVDVLDDRPPPATGFSPYGTSKVVGERVVRQRCPQAVVYRPPGVHGDDRRVTGSIRRIASSPLASVAGPGNQPTPQALRGNVGDAVAFITLSDEVPPPVVSHPWEGLTTSDLLELLGGRAPRRLPPRLCRLAVASGRRVGRWVPWVAASTRRVELLWFGQRQATSWLETTGWAPPLGRREWATLGRDESRCPSPVPRDGPTEGKQPT